MPVVKVKQLGEVDVVGRTEIAARCGVSTKAIDAWRRRDVAFPQPRWFAGSAPLWEWHADIEPWLAATGREHYAVATPA